MNQFLLHLGPVLQDKYFLSLILVETSTTALLLVKWRAMAKDYRGNAESQ